MPNLTLDDEKQNVKPRCECAKIWEIPAEDLGKTERENYWEKLKPVSGEKINTELFFIYVRGAKDGVVPCKC